MIVMCLDRRLEAKGHGSNYQALLVIPLKWYEKSDLHTNSTLQRVKHTAVLVVCKGSRPLLLLMLKSSTLRPIAQKLLKMSVSLFLHTAYYYTLD